MVSSSPLKFLVLYLFEEYNISNYVFENMS